MDMETTVLEIFGIACGVVIIMHQFPVYAWFVNKIGNRKPFSCELCMSFWTYLVYEVCMYSFTIESLLEAFICGFVGYWVSLKFLKW